VAKHWLWLDVSVSCVNIATAIWHKNKDEQCCGIDRMRLVCVFSLWAVRQTIVRITTVPSLSVVTLSAMHTIWLRKSYWFSRQSTDLVPGGTVVYLAELLAMFQKINQSNSISWYRVNTPELYWCFKVSAQCFRVHSPRGCYKPPKHRSKAQQTEASTFVNDKAKHCSSWGYWLYERNPFLVYDVASANSW
jgi:hypothetical protein